MFVDGYYAGQDGIPVKVSNAMCIFEKHSGDVMWRYTEAELRDQKVHINYIPLGLFLGGLKNELNLMVLILQIREVRPDISLVVRMVATVDNYDYVLDWEIKPSGSIKFGVFFSFSFVNHY